MQKLVFRDIIFHDFLTSEYKTQFIISPFVKKKPLKIHNLSNTIVCKISYMYHQSIFKSECLSLK